MIKERIDRLDFIERNLSRVVDWRGLIASMQDSCLVSKYYSYRCLYSDLWYIKRESIGNGAKIIEGCNGSGNMLYFQVILRALIDLKSGRPCDLGIWKDDRSPDYKSCEKTEHICFVDAENFLITLGEVEEVFAGLKPGCVADLTKRIKKDPIFKIGSLFPTNVLLD